MKRTENCMSIVAPEQQAREYRQRLGWFDEVLGNEDIEAAFLAGYEAAQTDCKEFVMEEGA